MVVLVIAHDFAIDVADGENRTAEDVVLRYLRDHPDLVDVRDWREWNLPWDFTFLRGGCRTTLDVKRDKYIESTQRFLIELGNFQEESPHIVPTWGMNRGLHFIAAVNKDVTAAYITPLAEVRRFVLASKPTGGWREGWCPNKGGYTTFSWAVPIAELLAAGVSVDRVSLVEEIRTPRLPFMREGTA